MPRPFSFMTFYFMSEEDFIGKPYRIWFRDEIVAGFDDKESAEKEFQRLELIQKHFNIPGILMRLGWKE